MRCKHCGAEMSDYHVFCTKCGQPLDMYGGGSASPQPAPEPKPAYPQEPAYSHDPAPEPYAAPDPKPYSDPEPEPEPYADPRPAPKPRKQRTGREPLLIAALALVAAAVVVLVIVLASGGRSRPTPQRPQSAVVTQQPMQTQQPVATPTPTPDPEYLLPDSDSRLLTEADLDPLTWEELCLARNEIFARHGRKFTTPEIDRYFSEKPWYHGTISPGDFSDSLLSETERANVQTIIAYEKKHYGGSYY